jgi:hypothetical protein
MPICENCGSHVETEEVICPFCNSPLKKKDNSKVFDEETEKIDELATTFSTNQITRNEAFSIEGAENSEFVLHTPQIDDMISKDEVSKQVPLHLEPIPLRNFFTWLVLGIITLGICFLIYLYLNIEDLEKHAMYPNEPKAEPIKVNTTTLLLQFVIAICFGFIPILWWIYYKKYASLYYHIHKIPRENAPVKIPHPVYYLLPLISSHIIALVPTIVGFVTGINIITQLPGLFWGISAGVFVLSIVTFYFDYLWQKAFNEHSIAIMEKYNVDYHEKLE